MDWSFSRNCNITGNFKENCKMVTSPKVEFQLPVWFLEGLECEK